MVRSSLCAASPLSHQLRFAAGAVSVSPGTAAGAPVAWPQPEQGHAGARGDLLGEELPPKRTLETAQVPALGDSSENGPRRQSCIDLAASSRAVSCFFLNNSA